MQGDRRLFSAQLPHGHHPQQSFAMGKLRKFLLICAFLTPQVQSVLGPRIKLCHKDAHLGIKNTTA